MSYMGLFWETGMPEAWALSRKSDDGPKADLTDGSLPDAGMAAQLWSQTALNTGVTPVIPNPANPAPENDGKTKG